MSVEKEDEEICLYLFLGQLPSATSICRMENMESPNYSWLMLPKYWVYCFYSMQESQGRKTDKNQLISKICYQIRSVLINWSWLASVAKDFWGCVHVFVEGTQQHLSDFCSGGRVGRTRACMCDYWPCASSVMASRAQRAKTPVGEEIITLLWHRRGESTASVSY